MTPESNGRLFSGTGTVGYEKTAEARIDLINDKTNNSLNLSNDVSQVTTSFEMGLFNRLDVFIKPTITTPTLTGLKFQLLGANRAEAAQGNTSLAFTLASGGSTQTSTGSSIFYEGDLNGYELSHNVTDVSIIFGHRFQADTLTYVSLNKTMHMVNITLESDSNAILDGESFTISNNSTGLNLGLVRYWNVFFLNLEGSVQEHEWSNTDKTTFANLNLNLGWKWN
jgi:hypothetical protein